MYNHKINKRSLIISTWLYNYFWIVFFFFSYRGDGADVSQSKFALNGIVTQSGTEKFEDPVDKFWSTREHLESQTRQHYLARSRYIAEQNGRMPYPSVYGTQQTISK